MYQLVVIVHHIPCFCWRHQPLHASSGFLVHTVHRDGPTRRTRTHVALPHRLNTSSFLGVCCNESYGCHLHMPYRGRVPMPPTACILRPTGYWFNNHLVNGHKTQLFLSRSYHGNRVCRRDYEGECGSASCFHAVSAEVGVEN